MWTQERDGFLRAHEHAFVRLGGVPKTIRHDNLKAAVVRACLYDPDVSEVYAAFGTHWGFVPLPSRPRHPEENGVAERSGGAPADGWSRECAPGPPCGSSARGTRPAPPGCRNGGLSVRWISRTRHCVRPRRYHAPSTTGGSSDPQRFRVAHPFHPLNGQEYELVGFAHTWGEYRVFFQEPGQTRVRSLPANWTDVVVPDPFLVLSAGRSHFRPEDLIQLVGLLAQLKRQL